MINYTEHLTLLMRDVVARVPTLSFIDIDDVLVFGRFGRSEAEGPFATCHCLTHARRASRATTSGAIGGPDKSPVAPSGS